MWTTQELLDVAFRNKPDFAPGAGWNYSNTNYVLAGLIMEKVTGKRLPERTSRVVVTLKPVTHWLFERPHRGQATPNRLVFQLQPQENIELGLMSSLAGPEWGALELQPLELELSVPTGLHRRIAYERLFLDAFNGNHALFVRDDEVRAAWHWIDSVADAWKNAELPLQPYAAGTWGPAEAAGFLPGDVIDTAHGDPA